MKMELEKKRRPKVPKGTEENMRELVTNIEEEMRKTNQPPESM